MLTPAERLVLEKLLRVGCDGLSTRDVANRLRGKLSADKTQATWFGLQQQGILTASLYSPGLSRKGIWLRLKDRDGCKALLAADERDRLKVGQRLRPSALAGATL